MIKAPWLPSATKVIAVPGMESGPMFVEDALSPRLLTSPTGESPASATEQKKHDQNNQDSLHDETSR
jgi:hypothetical protein